MHWQTILSYYEWNYYEEHPFFIHHLFNRAVECIFAFQIKCTSVSTDRGCRVASRLARIPGCGCIFPRDLSRSAGYTARSSLFSFAWEYTYSASGVPESTDACVSDLLPDSFSLFPPISSLNPGSFRVVSLVRHTGMCN